MERSVWLYHSGLSLYRQTSETFRCWERCPAAVNWSVFQEVFPCWTFCRMFDNNFFSANNAKREKVVWQITHFLSYTRDANLKRAWRNLFIIFCCSCCFMSGARLAEVDVDKSRDLFCELDWAPAYPDCNRKTVIKNIIVIRVGSLLEDMEHLNGRSHFSFKYYCLCGRRSVTRRCLQSLFPMQPV